ncbi:MAG: hypothetical protein Q9226_009434, partial [Calogaya cf. arnoldii]
DIGLEPNKIEWRSRYDTRPADLKEEFPEEFKKDDEVYSNTARGSVGPFKVAEVLGDGRYKLRKEDGKKMKKTYDKGNLSKLPRTIF